MELNKNPVWLEWQVMSHWVVRVRPMIVAGCTACWGSQCLVDVDLGFTESLRSHNFHQAIIGVVVSQVQAIIGNCMDIWRTWIQLIANLRLPLWEGELQNRRRRKYTSWWVMLGDLEIRLNLDDMWMTDMRDAIFLHFGGCMFDLVAAYVIRFEDTSSIYCVDRLLHLGFYLAAWWLRE